MVLAWLVAISIDTAPRQAAAAVFCVSTGNELSSALETASSNDQDDEIHVRDLTLTRPGIAGTAPRWEYSPYGFLDAFKSRAIVVSGGWTDCDTQVLDPRLTVLDAEYKGSAVHFVMDSAGGSIRVTNLTITRGLHYGNVLGGSAGAANLGVFAPNSTVTVKLDRLIVVAGQGTTDGTVAGGIQIRGHGGLTVDVSNNVIAYNSAIDLAGLSFNVSDSTVTVNNNSIFSNTATSDLAKDVGLRLLNSTGNTYVANNVIVDNKRKFGIARDFENAVGNSYLRNNHFGVATYTTAPVYNINLTTGDPGWTLTGIYPTPNAISPLRDSGANAPYGGVGTLDLGGNPRIINAAVDRGAIEAIGPNDRIFADDFDV